MAGGASKWPPTEVLLNFRLETVRRINVRPTASPRLMSPAYRRRTPTERRGSPCGEGSERGQEIVEGLIGEHPPAADSEHLGRGIGRSGLPVRLIVLPCSQHDLGAGFRDPQPGLHGRFVVSDQFVTEHIR